MIKNFKRNMGDSFVMSGRTLRHTFRSIDTLITVVALPIMLMLMFVYVLGGSINTGSINYKTYVLPGILLMCIVSGVAYTGYRLNNDIQNGIVERFRSMPIRKSSILNGHAITSILFNSFSLLIIIFFSFLIGFRTHASFAQWMMIIGILLLFMLCMTWIAIMFGMLANSSEGAGVFSYILMFLLFISSAFAPTTHMPTVVRIFAENQPMTPILQTLRSLFLQQSVRNVALLSVVWCVGILLISYAFTMRIYHRRFLK